MISKERLEELKSKYRFEACKIIENAESEQRFLTEKENKQLTKLEENLHECDKKLWALKYHATRTEELNLPMWEEFCEFDKLIPNFRFRFTDKDKENIALFLSEGLYGADPKNIIVYNFDGDYGFLFEEPTTEENYIKACDLCLKLFKGESE